MSGIDAGHNSGTQIRGSGPLNLVTPVVARHWALEVSWRGSNGRADAIGPELGVQRSPSLGGGEGKGKRICGLVDWRHLL
jgi:hypothetical protein